MIVVVGLQFLARVGVLVRFQIMARVVVGVVPVVVVAVVVGVRVLVDMFVGVGVGVFVAMNDVAVPVLVLVAVGVFVGVNVLVFVASAHGDLHSRAGFARMDVSAIGAALKAVPVPDFRCAGRTAMLPTFSTGGPDSIIFIM
jgi:hypothetical protein